MNGSKIATSVQMVVPNTAMAWALVTDTPTSLTLKTPYAEIQVLVENFPVCDIRPLQIARRGR